MVISWKLYKKGGKWKYEGSSLIPNETEIWDAADTVIDLIAYHQTDVVPACIIRREFHLVVSLVEGHGESDTKFFEGMFPALGEKK